MDMQGTLFKYGPLPANVAFKTLGTHKFHLIAVHGLTEGFLSMKYIQPLSLRLEENGIGVVYEKFAHLSLKRADLP